MGDLWGRLKLVLTGIMAGKRTKQAVVAAGENGHRRALVMIGKANVADDKPIVTEKADKPIA